MAYSIIDLEQIRLKVDKLVQAHQQLLEERVCLKQKIKEQEQEIDKIKEYNKEINLVGKQDIEKPSEVGLVSKDTEEIKQRINHLVREIDRSIAFLNA